jgi:hypothetical protein
MLLMSWYIFEALSEQLLQSRKPEGACFEKKYSAHEGSV